MSFYNPSFEDREMFAYNANYQKKQEERKTAKEELDRILSQPETRIKYAFEFMNDLLLMFNTGQVVYEGVNRIV